MASRRNLIGGAGAVTAATVRKVAMAALPGPVIQTKTDTLPPLVPNSGRPYNPVDTLSGWTLPWRMPDYMVMGERGMHDMTEMEMPLPDNAAALMTGTGPFGAVGMGGMFSVVKVRKAQKRGDYKDPGWFAHPSGTSATEWTGALAEPPREDKAAGDAAMKHMGRPKTDVEVTVRKPAGGHDGH